MNTQEPETKECGLEDENAGETLRDRPLVEGQLATGVVRGPKGYLPEACQPRPGHYFLDVYIPEE